MPTGSGKEYHFGEANVTMSPNPEKPSTSMDHNLLIILEDIRAQHNLGQRIDRIENDRCDEDHQSSPHREDRFPRNHDRLEDDDPYIKNIKLDVSNFDGRLDPQY